MVPNCRRDFFIARILHAKLPIDGYHYIGGVSWEDKLYAQHIYQETLEQAQLEGLFPLNEVVDLLKQPHHIAGYRYGMKLWTDEEEDKLIVLKDDIEKLKVGIFQSHLRSAQKEAARTGLRKAEKEVERLLAVKHSLDGMTAEGLAIMYRQIYLIGCSIYRNDGARVYRDGWWVLPHTPILHQALRTYTEGLIPEPTFRSLARNDPWRSIWSSRKGDGLFGRPSVELSDEQRNLILWSQFYDNVYESPDCPSDEIIDDDDALDGWMIAQRKKREKESLANSIESKLSDKAKSADEVYIPVDTPEEGRKLDSLNSIQSQIVKRQRLNQIRREGRVDEINFADNQQKLKKQLEDIKKEREK